MLQSKGLLGDDATTLQSSHKLIIGCSSISFYDTSTPNQAQEVVQRYAVPPLRLLRLISVLQKDRCVPCYKALLTASLLACHPCYRAECE